MPQAYYTLSSKSWSAQRNRKTQVLSWILVVQLIKPQNIFFYKNTVFTLNLCYRTYLHKDLGNVSSGCNITVAHSNCETHTQNHSQISGSFPQKIWRWLSVQVISVYCDKGPQVFPAQCCIVTRWSMHFTTVIYQVVIGAIDDWNVAAHILMCVIETYS